MLWDSKRNVVPASQSVLCARAQEAPWGPMRARADQFQQGHLLPLHLSDPTSLIPSHLWDSFCSHRFAQYKSQASQ